MTLHHRSYSPKAGLMDHQQPQRRNPQQQQLPKAIDDDDILSSSRSICACLPLPGDGSMSSMGSSTGVDIFSSRALGYKQFPDMSDDESPRSEVPFSLPSGVRRRGVTAGGTGGSNAGSSGNLVILEDRAPSEGQGCTRVKLMCSWGGKIMPRPSDGKLRYVGGETRLATVNRDIQYAELMVRMCDLCEQPVVVKYQMPEEDLDALISVCNAEDLENMMEEYDRLEAMLDGGSRLRLFLFPSLDFEMDFLEASVDPRDPEQQYYNALNGNGTIDLLGFRKDSAAGDSASGGSASNSHCNDLIGLEVNYHGDSSDASSLVHASTSAVNGSLATSTPVSPRILPWGGNVNLPAGATVNFYQRVAFETAQVNTTTTVGNVTTGFGQPELQPPVFDPEATEVSSPLRSPIDQGQAYHGDVRDQYHHHLRNSYSVPDFAQYHQDAHHGPAFMQNAPPPPHHHHNHHHDHHQHGSPVAPMLQRSPTFHAVYHGVAPGGGGHHHMQPSAPPPCMVAPPVQVRCICELPGRHPRNHCGGFLPPPCYYYDAIRRIWWHAPCHCAFIEGQIRNTPLLQAECSSPPPVKEKVLHHGFTVQNFGHEENAGMNAGVNAGGNLRGDLGVHTEVGPSPPQAEVPTSSGLTLTSMKDSHGVIESLGSSSRQCGTSGPASVSDSVIGQVIVGSEIQQRNQEVESPIDAKIQQCARLLEDSLQADDPSKTTMTGVVHEQELRKPELHTRNTSEKAPETTEGFVAVTAAAIRTTVVQQPATVVPSEVATVVATEQAVVATTTMEVKEGEEAPRSTETEVISRRLQKIKNCDIEEIKLLGSGTFGTVYYGKWRNSDVAIKRIKPSCFTQRPSERDRLIADFWREADTLANLSHPNVVAFYGVVPDGPDGTLATVTEYMVNGSLKQVLQRKDRTIDRRKRILLAMDAASGMEYLHEKKIVHFDLKCENLLVNMRDPAHPVCKVGDFGLSKVKRQTMVSGGVRGTLPWMAPELLSSPNNMVTEKVDVFSFGIVMWELLTGEEPYRNLHQGEIIGGIVSNNLRPEIPIWCEPFWRSLMERCWAADPQDRPSFTEIARELRDAPPRCP